MNPIHTKIKTLQDTLQEASRSEVPIGESASLVESTHRTLRSTAHGIDPSASPVMRELLLSAADALPESGTRATEQNVAKAFGLLKQAHALVHDVDPHGPQ